MKTDDGNIRSTSPYSIRKINIRQGKKESKEDSASSTIFYL